MKRKSLEKELEYIREHAGKVNSHEMARRLGLSVAHVRELATTRGISLDMTKEKRERVNNYIKENPDADPVRIAQACNCTTTYAWQRKYITEKKHPRVKKGNFNLEEYINSDFILKKDTWGRD